MKSKRTAINKNVFYYIKTFSYFLKEYDKKTVKGEDLLIFSSFLIRKVKEQPDYYKFSRFLWMDLDLMVEVEGGELKTIARFTKAPMVEF